MIAGPGQAAIGSSAGAICLCIRREQERGGKRGAGDGDAGGAEERGRIDDTDELMAAVARPMRRG